MAGPYGRMCRNLHGESLNIKGKLVLDPFCNLVVANAEINNVHVSGNIFTNGICEYEMGEGIMLKGNVTMRNGDTLCADTIKANTIIGNLTGELNVESLDLDVLTANTIVANGNVSVCGNIFTDSIRGKTGNTIALHGNLVVTPPGTAIISETLFTSTIIENTTNAGIDVMGNICQSDGSLLQTSKISPKNVNNGVVIDTYLPKNKFGLSRVYANTFTTVQSNVNVEVPLNVKSFESGFTTTRGLSHPNGNTLVTFQAPSTANINCEYTSALVSTNVGFGIQVNSGNVGDYLSFLMSKNVGTPLSIYNYPIVSNISSATNISVTWSDTFFLAPDDIVGFYVYGGNISGTLDAEVVGGSVATFASFEIKSFEA